MREVSEKLYEHARLGGAKVVWIGDAAMLTDAAANALLKTLEEPPENTRFFWPVRSQRACWQRCAAAVVCITLLRLQNATRWRG